MLVGHLVSCFVWLSTINSLKKLKSSLWKNEGLGIKNWLLFDKNTSHKTIASKGLVGSKTYSKSFFYVILKICLVQFFFFWNNFSSKKLKIKINYIYLVFEIELFYDLNLSFTIIYLWKIIMSTFEQVRHNIYEACLK